MKQLFKSPIEFLAGRATAMRSRVIGDKDLNHVISLAIDAGKHHEDLVKTNWNLGSVRNSKAYQSLTKLRALVQQRRRWEIGLISPNLHDFGDAYEHVPREHFNIFTIEPAAFLRGEFPEVDVLIIRGATVNTDETLAAAYSIMSGRPRVLTLCYGWDHHHIGRVHALMSIAFDIFVPMHESSVDYLRSLTGLVTRPVWAFSQFTNPQVIDDLAKEALRRPRSNALYGKFTAYGHPRDILVERCRKEIEGSIVECRPGFDNSGDYLKISERERFLDWASYKVSVSLSIHNDIPMRIYDALLTGQIPLVSRNVTGFERIFSEAEQKALPIIRFSVEHPLSIKAAWQRALKRFDEDGDAGITRRHACVRRHHLLQNRLKMLFDILDEYAEEAVTL